jgi:hypothetical protein
MSEKKQLCIMLQHDTYQQLKIAAKKSGYPMVILIDLALKAYFDKK